MPEVKLKFKVNGYSPVAINASAFDKPAEAVDLSHCGTEWEATLYFKKNPQCLQQEIVKCEIEYEVNELRLPNSINSVSTSLGWLAIEDKDDLSISPKMISADGNLIVFGDKVLRQIGNAPEISIPEGITIIGEGAFMGKEKLQKVEFSKTVTQIERKAFSGCINLPVKLPRAVQCIGDYAFERCGWAVEKRGKLTIPSKVTSIGRFAFKSCTSITGVKIPNSVTEMGQGAFAGADRVKLFEGKGASENGQFLIWDKCLIAIALDTSIMMHDTINLPMDLEEIGDWAFTYDDPKRHWRPIKVLPTCLKRIGEHSLFGFGMWTTPVIIPDSVENIGEGAFSPEMMVAGKFVDDDGNVIKDGTLLFKNGQPDDKPHEEFTIPNGVSRIGSYANIFVEHLTIPEGVVSIGDKAVTVLKHISIPSSLSSIEGHGLICKDGCDDVVFNGNLISLGYALGDIRVYSVSFTSNPPIFKGVGGGNSLIIVPQDKFIAYKQAYTGIISDGGFINGRIAYLDKSDVLHREILDATEKEVILSFWKTFEELAPSNETFENLLEKYPHEVTEENGECFYYIDILPNYLRIELRFNKLKGLGACTLHELQKAERYEGIHFFAFNQATGYTRSFKGIDKMAEKSSNCIYIKEKSGLRNDGIVWKIPTDTDSMEIYALLYAAANIQAEKILPLLPPKDV